MDILEDYLKKSKYWEELHKPTRGLFNVAPMKIVQIIEDYERVKKLNIDDVSKCLHPYKKVISGDDGMWCTECNKYITTF